MWYPEVLDGSFASFLWAEEAAAKEDYCGLPIQEGKMALQFEEQEIFFPQNNSPQVSSVCVARQAQPTNPEVMRIPEVCPVVKETAEDSLYKGYVHMAVHIQSGSV